MAKHPVPKRKTSKCATRRRYSTFRSINVKRLLNEVQLVNCSNCNEPRKAHHVCTKCGMYRGRQVIDMSAPESKITKIKV